MVFDMNDVSFVTFIFSLIFFASVFY
jgi:hypothetical protein